MTLTMADVDLIFPLDRKSRNEAKAILSEFDLFLMGRGKEKITLNVKTEEKAAGATLKIVELYPTDGKDISDKLYFLVERADVSLEYHPGVKFVFYKMSDENPKDKLELSIRLK